MELEHILYLMYGMCIMFHLMMAWIFSRRGLPLSKRLIGALMLLIAFQYIKDLPWVSFFYTDDCFRDRLSTCLDMVTVPVYAMVLFEFCRPGSVTLRRGLLAELPFLIFSLLYIVFVNSFFFYALIAMSIAYGTWCAVWTLHELPIYHRRLKEEYSYDEEINLHWLRGVMIFFYIILAAWVYQALFKGYFSDLVYMTVSLVSWSVVCYFINRQDVVFREVVGSSGSGAMDRSDIEAQTTDSSEQQPCPQPAVPAPVSVESSPQTSDVDEQMVADIYKAFEEDKIYLNPKLRLSDLAARIGTNRTYMSQYFNHTCEQSFYEYVNNYRVRHSMGLLSDTDYTLEIIAEMSGFNSLSTFRRAFIQKNGCSPQQYRSEMAL
ncbi:helix-turn-helix domain-containing protein [Prevotella sp.]|uniref:helix-turn-helix domain-containing protein n=1 Tax=Prevotella sp. TaxID=59823 RepID=UPI00307CC5E6